MDTIRIGLTPEQRREAALEYRAHLSVAPANRGARTRRIVPWSRVSRAIGGPNMLFVAAGWRVIAIPKALDPSGELWSLLREKLTGTRMLIPGSGPRDVIANTANHRTSA